MSRVAVRFKAAYRSRKPVPEMLARLYEAEKKPAAILWNGLWQPAAQGVSRSIQSEPIVEIVSIEKVVERVETDHTRLLLHCIESFPSARSGRHHFPR